MYLKGSKFNPAKPRQRANPFRLIILLALIGAVSYVNWVIVPVTPPLFIATATPTRSPESFLTDAEKFVEEGKGSQAIESYKEAIKADPNNPATYVTLARLQVLQGDITGATENVENALLINQNHALAKAIRGWISVKEKRYVEAEAQLDEALVIDPNSALAYAYLAEMYAAMIEEDAGDLNTLDKASAASTKAMELDPNQLEVRWARGRVLEVTGNYARAIEEYKAAIAINGNLVDLYIALARNYRNDPENPQYGQAIELLNRAISLRPDIREPYSEQALTYLKVGDYAKAVQMAMLAVERAPTDPLMHGLLGTSYFRNKDYEPAAAELSLAVRGGLTSQGEQVTPIPADGGYTFVAYYARYGISLAALNRCPEALTVAQQLMQTAPNDDNAKINADDIQDTCRDFMENPPADATTTPGADETATPQP